MSMTNCNDGFTRYLWNPDTWATEDCKILKARRKGDECQEWQGDGYTMTYTVRVPRYIRTRAEAKAYLEGVFYRRCHCAHDCCGHLFSSVHTYKMVRKNRREYIIPVGYAHNI